MKPSGIINFENVPADAGDPDVKIYVNGEEVSSGGGGGDFTTAVITTAADAGTDNVTAPIPVVDESGIILPVEIEPNKTYTVVLYKGKLNLTVMNFGLVSFTVVSGDAEVTLDNDYKVVVTGDCEITWESVR